MHREGLLLALLATMAHRVSSAPAPAPEPQAVHARPVVLPEDTHTRLEIQTDTLDWLETLEGPLAVVAVIGPYRSGKSFLLNKLLELPCDKGFGVGHKRSTMTKGIWMWGAPQKQIRPDGTEQQVLYLDTEGFEGAGSADVYDDRIFAFSALVSSALIYNLPENIKETDIEKLSFAVELSEEFFKRSRGGGAGELGAGSLDMPTLLWLIQRDFLQGKGVRDHVEDVLQQVDNPKEEKHIANLNRIRASLKSFHNYSGFGLRQPHVDRTKLCGMGDAELDPGYTSQLQDLKQLLRSICGPKQLNAQPLNGKGLRQLIEKVVSGLNSREIPSAGSLVDTFNKEVVERCLGAFRAELDRVLLPVPSTSMSNHTTSLLAEAASCWQRSQFGHGNSSTMEEQMGRLVTLKEQENLYASQKLCEQLWSDCEGVLAKAGGSWLPSTKRFRASFQACNNSFSLKCQGPAQRTYQDRMGHSWQREEAGFNTVYFNHLSQALVIVSVIIIIMSRFFFKSGVGELVGWLLFAVITLLPKFILFGSEDALWSSTYGRQAVHGYENLVYNQVWDLNDSWGIFVLLLLVPAICSRIRRRKICRDAVRMAEQNTGAELGVLSTKVR